MKQYCRYCSHMICGDANWCEELEKTFADRKLTTENKCKQFAFCEQAADRDDLVYSPRAAAVRENSYQLKLEM